MRLLMNWLMPITWMGCLFYSSSQPYEEQNIKPFLSSNIDLSFLEVYLDWISFTYHQSEVSIAALGMEGFIEFFIRKGAHFGAFFLLLILFYAAFRKTVNWTIRKIIVVSFFLTLAYAMVDELHQGMTPNRTPFVGDVLIDAIGAIAACLLLLARNKYKRNTIVKK
ncbi:VanZ family protein [Ornithinibacillus contaminans]|uniref:VanZ family protein n=1 Tax=Ornithinibacillus contaminans TaxID=694055 RepID=UPI00064DA54F|nr:VanZ family protein [Ornithinibacillus contaminans]